jgi:hypothetical protein
MKQKYNYLIVYRFGDSFTPVIDNHVGRGDSPDEVWVYGYPNSDDEVEISQCHEPIIKALEDHSTNVIVHRIK